MGKNWFCFLICLFNLCGGAHKKCEQKLWYSWMFVFSAVLESIAARFTNRASRSSFCSMPTILQPIAIISPIDVRTSNQEWANTRTKPTGNQPSGRSQSRRTRTKKQFDGRRWTHSMCTDKRNRKFNLLVFFSFFLSHSHSNLFWHIAGDRTETIAAKDFNRIIVAIRSDHFHKMQINDVNALGWQRIHPNAVIVFVLVDRFSQRIRIN